MSPSRLTWRRRRRRRIRLGVATLVLLGSVGLVVVLTHGPGNVSNPDVEFRAEATPTTVPVPGRESKGAKKVKPLTWPMYGYSADRRRQLSVPRGLRPPFERKWSFNGHHLLEFPPVISGDRLFLLKDNGVMHAIDKHTGKAVWSRKLGNLAASSPAVQRDRVFATVLSNKRGGPGKAFALSANTGKILWSRDLPSRTESSPLVAAAGVYFGSENGTVYGLRQSDGGVRWTFRASGAVKGGVALKDGKLFFGDYAGKLYAIRLSDGKQVWQATTQGAKFGFSSGQFYATPAVAYGRVYLGNTDGYVYSFDEDRGELAWQTKTAGYVYASPAVGQAPGDRPTVYAGSYDGTFYAMDARSGAIRWRYGGGSKISGGATLLGDIVYFSDLGHRRTIGLGARTGRKVFSFPRGGYDPVVTDGRTLFLIGYGAMYALSPLTASERRQIAHRKRERLRAARERLRAAAQRQARLIGACHDLADRNYTRHDRNVVAFRRCVKRKRVKARHQYCARRARAHHADPGERRRSFSRCARR